MSRTKRRPYTGDKAVDPSCRNHGSDLWAKNNRLYKNKKRQQQAKSKEKGE